jgi:hypothetical protein
MLVTLLGIVRLVSALSEVKELFPMLVILFGIVMLVRMGQL